MIFPYQAISLWCRLPYKLSCLCQKSPQSRWTKWAGRGRCGSALTWFVPKSEQTLVVGKSHSISPYIRRVRSYPQRHGVYGEEHGLEPASAWIETEIIAFISSREKAAMLLYLVTKNHFFGDGKNVLLPPYSCGLWTATASFTNAPPGTYTWYKYSTSLDSVSKLASILWENSL